jgi:hypothetical protein
MTDNTTTDTSSSVKIDGRTGFEIVGTIDVVRVEHEEGAARPYHLELEFDDEIAQAILKYGSDTTTELDLINTGLRSSIIERIRRLQEEAES